ncbi:hypothetical protein Tco_0309442 [Tanacetum coccineum]
MDLTLTSESSLMQLNELAELRDGAYENTRIYKEQTKKWHDSRLHGDKDFKIGDKVLLYNFCLKMYPIKLKSKWNGPSVVKTVYPHGAIEITNKDGFSFKVNGQRLKKYYRGNINKEDDKVIEFENGVMFLNTAPVYGYGVLVSGPRCKEIDKVGEVSIIWNLVIKNFKPMLKKTKPDLDEDDTPMSREEEAKFMQTFCKTRFYNDYRDRDSNRDNWRSNERSSYNRDNYRSNTDDKPYDLQKQFNDFMKSQQSTNAFVKETFHGNNSKNHLEPIPKSSIFNLKPETKVRQTCLTKAICLPFWISSPHYSHQNPKAYNSKAYQPPQSRNEHVNAVFTRSGKSYNPPVNPNDQQNDSETPINFDSDDENEEPTP